ncbi:7,8-didemethyl-8-hydroxy-5-deazariboflavin synthase CofG [bacterium]|jgi:7,8-didemethyl-8-hydroxy-5-deazariboflavin synthase CofG subunit|nr:7,8-didemethyl-8-hydroxy-5-deazariboflavin synthase CofG [bacterium]MBT3794957.1 7,8-didemethyl-8-hydroxy-5-deazariboflavin synthase CofG [bacterium]
MISLNEAHEIFLNSHSSAEILRAHDIPVGDIEKLTPTIRISLEKALNEVDMTRDDILALTDISIENVAVLMSVSNFLRDKHKGTLISFSKNFFIPLTQLCRDKCSYCTFKYEPGEGELFYSPEKVLEAAKKSAELGCTEMLFVSGDKPELVYDVYRKELNKMGYDSTSDYMIAMSEICLEEGIFPHSNLGIAKPEELKRFKNSNPSMGLMLESISERLMEPGEAHYRCPDKYPRARIKTISDAGKLNIPWTSGILIGIGETWEERVDSIFELKRISDEFGHIQEIIIQNFSPKPGIKMEGSPVPTDLDMIKTVAMAKILMGKDVNIQVPPNLNAKTYTLHIFSGVNDLGGVSPLTIDYVNPESPWPQLDIMKKNISEFGFTLRERLPVYPEYLDKRFLTDNIYNKALKFVDETGYIKEG